MLLTSLVFSQLDYCNALYYGMPMAQFFSVASAKSSK